MAVKVGEVVPAAHVCSLVENTEHRGLQAPAQLRDCILLSRLDPPWRGCRGCRSSARKNAGRIAVAGLSCLWPPIERSLLLRAGNIGSDDRVPTPGFDVVDLRQQGVGVWEGQLRGPGRMWCDRIEDPNLATFVMNDGRAP